MSGLIHIWLLKIVLLLILFCLVPAEKSVVVTSDGATILRHLRVVHPAAQLLVRTALKQDEVVGDGTTSVVILAGSLARRALHFMTIQALTTQSCTIIATQLSHAFYRATIEALTQLRRFARSFDDSAVHLFSLSLSLFLNLIYVFFLSFTSTYCDFHVLHM